MFFPLKAVHWSCFDLSSKNSFVDAIGASEGRLVLRGSNVRTMSAERTWHSIWGRYRSVFNSQERAPLSWASASALSRRCSTVDSSRPALCSKSNSASRSPRSQSGGRGEARGLAYVPPEPGLAPGRQRRRHQGRPGALAALYFDAHPRLVPAGG